MSQSLSYNAYSNGGVLVLNKRKLADIKSHDVHIKELESITSYAIRREDLARFNQNLLNLREQQKIENVSVLQNKIVSAVPQNARQVFSFQFMATDLSLPAASRPSFKLKSWVGRIRQSRWFAIGAASLVLLIGFAIFISTIKTNNEVVAQVAAVTENPTESMESTSEIPSESPIDPNEFSKYKVAADMPRLVKIDKLGIEGRVLRMGLLADNSIASPRSIFDTGWYEGSSKPGESGASLIVGHVSGPTAAGIFKNLNKLNNGDIINIEKGDGTILNYKVVSKKQSSSTDVDMAAALSPVTKGKNGLNLMTCAGKYDKSTNAFQDRLVVFAEQV